MTRKPYYFVASNNCYYHLLTVDWKQAGTVLNAFSYIIINFSQQPGNVGFVNAHFADNENKTELGNLPTLLKP